MLLSKDGRAGRKLRHVRTVPSEREVTTRPDLLRNYNA